MLPERVYGREGDVFWDPGRGTDVGDEGPSTGESDFDVVDINELGKIFEGIDDAKLGASARKTSSSCSLSLLVDTR
jgi:hypothetical protein